MRIVALFILLISFFSVNAKTFYSSYVLSSDGSIGIFNSGSEEVYFDNNSLEYGSAPSATYIKTLKNGDKIYRNVSPYAKVEYILSADKKHLAQIMYMGDNWVFTNWLTSERNERTAFYNVNRNYQREGVRFNYSFNNQESGRTEENIKSNSSCSQCGGTGINPFHYEGYAGRASWLAAFNPSGERCKVCGKYDTHYHERCSSCNNPYVH